MPQAVSIRPFMQLPFWQHPVVQLLQFPPALQVPLEHDWPLGHSLQIPPPLPHEDAVSRLSWTHLPALVQQPSQLFAPHVPVELLSPHAHVIIPNATSSPMRRSLILFHLS